MSKSDYNSRLKNFARENRKAGNKAEVRLWCEVLRKGQLGVKFKRQRPIGNYIVDFLCQEKKLVIEVDGYSHQIAENIEKDIERQGKIEQMGYWFLRFTHKEVMNEVESVRYQIEEWLRQN